jgi:hypothetical protein
MSNLCLVAKLLEWWLLHIRHSQQQELKVKVTILLWGPFEHSQHVVNCCTETAKDGRSASMVYWVVDGLHDEAEYM